MSYDKDRETMSADKLTAKYGPLYPDMGQGVAKFRTIAKKCGGVQKMSEADRWAYGSAIEKKILAMQRSELQRELPEHKVNCASGCASPDGVGDHMRRKQRAALAACPGMERRARTDQQWREMYEQAMADKRSRETIKPMKRREVQTTRMRLRRRRAA